MGKVYLIGAGPGDKGLMTLKGAKILAIADVVIYDRLVGSDILDMVSYDAIMINAGKKPGNHPISQEEINSLIYENALKYNVVVRLKGGDPFMFGRGGEELELLVEHGIDYEIVPGVTSAVSAPAYAGIPVTHRDFCSSLHIITGHGRGNGVTDIAFSSLVKIGGTLVFLMSVATARDIADGLLSAGMSKDMPVAIIENGTRPSQRSFTGELYKLPEIISKNNIKPPSVIVVGKVCSLGSKYDWYNKLKEVIA